MRIAEWIALMAAAAAAGGAEARSKRQVAEDQLRAMLACSGIAEVAPRVACYDAAARQVIAADPRLAGQAPAARTAMSTQPPAPAAPSFGSDNLPRERRGARAERAETMTARIVSRTEDERGMWTYAFDNGQAWQFTETTEFNLPRPGASATVRRGLMGGYLMDLGGGAQVRVRRVR